MLQHVNMIEGEVSVWGSLMWGCPYWEGWLSMRVGGGTRCTWFGMALFLFWCIFLCWALLEKDRFRRKKHIQNHNQHQQCLGNNVYWSIKSFNSYQTCPTIQVIKHSHGNSGSGVWGNGQRGTPDSWQPTCCCRTLVGYHHRAFWSQDWKWRHERHVTTPTYLTTLLINPSTHSPCGWLERNPHGIQTRKGKCYVT